MRQGGGLWPLLRCLRCVLLERRQLIQQLVRCGLGCRLLLHLLRLALHLLLCLCLLQQRRLRRLLPWASLRRWPLVLLALLESKQLIHQFIR